MIKIVSNKCRNLNFLKLMALLLCAFSSLLGKGQISGNVTDIFGNSIPGCQVYYIQGHEILQMTVSDNNGNYELVSRTDLSFDSINLRFYALGYGQLDTTINLAEGIIEDLNIALSPLVFELDSITVLETAISIVERNDTTVYNVKSFEQDPNAKLVDVLEKLPGVSVDRATGEVKYKGKPVETIMIDGDDLLGKSYSQAIRMLPARIISRIEGIEDYHSQKLRKGIETSDATALNLITSSDAKMLNGEGVVGAGVGPHYFMGLDMFSIFRNNKLLVGSEINNISINNSPFYSPIFRREHADIIVQQAYKPYENSVFEKPPPSELAYDNDLKFGQLQWSKNWNNGPKLSLTTGVYGDDFGYSDEQTTSFFSADEVIRQAVRNSNLLKVRQFLSEAKLKYDRTENKFLEINIKTWQPYTLSDLLQTINDSTSLTQYRSDSKYCSGGVVYQFKPVTSHLLSISVNFSQDSFASDFSESSFKNISGRRSIIHGVAEWLTKTGTGSRSILLLGKITDLGYSSFGTDFDAYRQLFVGLKLLQKYNLKNNWSVSYSFLPHLLKQQYDSLAAGANVAIKPFDQVLLDSKLMVGKTIGQYDILNFSMAYENKSIEPRNLTGIEVLDPNGTIVSSGVGLSVPKEAGINVIYSHNNLLQGLSYQGKLTLKLISDAFVPTYTIDEEVLKIIYRQSELAIYNLGLSASTEIIFSSIEHRLKVETSFSRSESYVGRNTQSENFEPVNTNNFSAYLELASAFGGPINYALSTEYLINSGRSGADNFSSSTQISTAVNLKMKLTKRLFANLGTDYQYTSFFANDYYSLILSANVKYDLKKYCSIYLRGSNISGQKSISFSGAEEGRLIEYSSSVYGPYVILGGSFNF